MWSLFYITVLRPPWPLPNSIMADVGLVLGLFCFIIH